MNTSNYFCLNDCDTRNLRIDPNLYLDKSKYASFKKGGIYTIYGELKDTKAVYDETLSTHEYDVKFIGWVTKDFVLKNFVDEKTFSNEMFKLDELYSYYLEL